MTTLEPSRPSVSSICERHPDQPVTGFCADCLRERLAGLDQLQEPRRKSTSSAISGNPLRAIFRAAGEPSRPSNVSSKPSSSSASSFLPELRRCKSFSAPRAEGFFSGLFEPQRKSCDVRGRSTLYSLFNQADETAAGNVVDPRRPSNSETTVAAAAHEIEQAADEEIEEVEEEVETKTMKDHIDLDAARKTEKEKKDIASGGFWGAASVFSKKLQNWRRKQKAKKAMRKSSTAASVAGDAAAGKASSFSRRFRDTQSEVADYGFGRRSCDTDPRFSLDAGRISLDDPRFSFDEPRASWDGYLVGAGRREGPRFPTMLSVIEDLPPPPVPRSDAEIPVEMEQLGGDESSEPPGGTTQTREYYSDSSSSSRRKKSLERLGSVKKTPEIDETKPVYLNAKVAPTSSDYNYFPGSQITTGGFSGGLGDSKDSSLNSLHDNCWESYDSMYRDGAAASRKIGGGGGGGKKSRRWGMAWSIWGLIHRRSKEEDEKSIQTSSVIDRSFSESWPDLRRVANAELRGGMDRRVFRCNSSVSSRGSWVGNGGAPAPAMPPAASWSGRRRKEESPALERNRSARYSPGHFDNGLLRFYLTPLRGSRRNGFGVAGKIKPKSSSNSFARSMLRLY